MILSDEDAINRVSCIIKTSRKKNEILIKNTRHPSLTSVLGRGKPVHISRRTLMHICEDVKLNDRDTNEVFLLFGYCPPGLDNEEFADYIDEDIELNVRYCISKGIDAEVMNNLMEVVINEYREDQNGQARIRIRPGSQSPEGEVTANHNGRSHDIPEPKAGPGHAEGIQAIPSGEEAV